MGTMTVILESNGWRFDAKIKLIEGNRPSIIGRDLMPQLGLQLIQQTPGDQIMSIDDEPKGESGQDGSWIRGIITSVSSFQTFLNGWGKKNNKVQAELFEKLTPVQQKGR